MFRASLVIFGTCMAVYLANGRAHPEVDCVAAPYTAWSLVRHGSLNLRYYPELGHYVGCDAGFHVRALPTGMWISQRPPGDALAAVPVVAPLALFSERPPESSVMMMLGKVAAALAVAGASVLFFHVCRQVAPGGCWPATVLFAFGTCLWSVASQALWMHGPATLWLCCALYGATHPTVKNWPLALVTGVSLGLAVVTRPTTCLFALATVGALVFQRNWRALLYVCLGGAIPAIFLLGLNWSLFGDPLLGGYGGEWTHSQAPPFWLGLAGLLLAPSRGVLIYSPALLLVPFGALLLARRSDGLQAGPRVMLVTWLAASLGTLLLYARWHAWWGGWCYGPRFLCETMPTFCLVFALGYQTLRQVWQRRWALGLVALSVGVHFAGVFGHGAYQAWEERHDLPDQGLSLFALRDTQIGAHARGLAGKFMRIPAGKR